MTAHDPALVGRAADAAWAAALREDASWESIARAVLDTITASPRHAVIELPEPGPLSDHHGDSETVWYFGQYGEFTFDSYDNSLHDTEGNAWGGEELREMALAGLAAARAAESGSTTPENKE